MKSARRLLIHERWTVGWVDNGRKKVLATGQMSRRQRVYGPERNRLATAASADLVFGVVINFAGQGDGPPSPSPSPKPKRS